MHAEALAPSAALWTLSQDHRLIRLHTALSEPQFVVKRFVGQEAVSRPFNYEVEVLTAQPRLALKELVGQPASLSLGDEFGGSRVHGYVQEVASVGQQAGLNAFRLKIAPWLAFLDYSSTCRVFQDLTVLQIIERVFHDYPDLARYRYDLDSSGLRARPYCVQYNETDFAFVSRLLEDEGLYYSFEHDADGHTLIISDDSTHSTVHGEPRPVPFLSDQGTLSQTGLHQWQALRRVGPAAQRLRSYDFKQPRQMLEGEGDHELPLGNVPSMERYHYDGAARFGTTRAGGDLARIRDEEAHWQNKWFTCSGNTGELAAASTFRLERHLDFIGRDDADREFFVVALWREGSNNFDSDLVQSEAPSLKVRAEVLRRAIAFRPVRSTPVPRMGGPQTATVVGPPGEEIHADKYGRVRVQFHWDRQLDRREDASCWIRVSSPWAGAGMGAVQAPRIGQEVVVDFLDGDPSRPLITGRVYNEDNMPPFGLEISGLKSKTVKGSGWNEMTMHDADGDELLNLRAQRDMVTTVLHDQKTTVGNDKTTTVDRDHAMAVKRNQEITVDGARTIKVLGDDTLTVEGARSTSVTKSVSEKYSAGHSKTIEDKGYSEQITGGYSSAQLGNYSASVTGHWDATVTGAYDHTVQGPVNISYQAQCDLAVGGDYLISTMGEVDDSSTGKRSISTRQDFSLSARGKFSQSAEKEMSASSQEKISIKVGDSSIALEKDKITLSSSGSKIVIDSSGVAINGKEIKLNA